MRVHTKVVIDIESGETLLDEYYEYAGPVAQCGGSSGGGGSSGTVDYPDYMKRVHEGWLGAIDAFLPANNPYILRNAPSMEALDGWDNDTLVYFEQYLNQRLYEARQINFDPYLPICLQQPQFYTEVMNMICFTLRLVNDNYSITIPSELENFQVTLNNRMTELASLGTMEGSFDLETEIYPRFEAGMRDINAVQMSTFVIGRGVIAATYAAKAVEIQQKLKQDVLQMMQQVADKIAALKFEAQTVRKDRVVNLLQVIQQLFGVAGGAATGMDNAKINLEVAMNQMHVDVLKSRVQAMASLDAVTDGFYKTSLEFERIRLVARFEQATFNSDYDEKEARWDLENFQYAANMLAAIGGGTVAPGNKQPNKTQSALGGALSGAAAGAAAGFGAPGAVVGGLIGLGAALL